MTSKSLWHTILAPFLTFTMMFIGAGFISGSIVHLGEGINSWDLGILTTGVLLFIVGSYVQESIYNKKNLKEEGAITFLLYSLLLSLGIGMASGGTQHYIDTPSYSAILIPTGLTLGLFAFILKNNIKLSLKSIARLVFGVVASMSILGMGLVYGASYLPQGASHNHGNEQQSHAAHTMSISSEQEFLTEMIPHHQEAVDTSHLMLQRAQSPEQRAFLENIIFVQTKEISMLKTWHQEWYGAPYEENTQYMHMMPDLEKITDDNLAWQAYLQGMILHHEGAVTMAEQVLPLSGRQEIRDFARAVISAQSVEIEQMRYWQQIEDLKLPATEGAHQH